MDVAMSTLGELGRAFGQPLAHVVVVFWPVVVRLCLEGVYVSGGFGS